MTTTEKEPLSPLLTRHSDDEYKAIRAGVERKRALEYAIKAFPNCHATTLVEEAKILEQYLRGQESEPTT